MEFPPTFEGLKERFKLQKFAEGYRGEIYIFTHGGKKLAVKKPQEKRLVKTFQKEAQILSFLKEKGVKFVPQIEFYGRDYFIYRFIEGEPFKKIWKSADAPRRKRLLKKMLLAAYVLDCLGVFKNEFQRPFTNVLVSGRKLYLLDFERGKLGKRWKNLPQLLQFLMAVDVLNREETISLGKEYKNNPRGVLKRTLRMVEERFAK
jgi:putative serine/threonine protein kinase